LRLRERAALLTRRRFLMGAALAAGGVAAGLGIDRLAGNGPQGLFVRLGSQPVGLPERQHAWSATLERDADGNPIPPRFDRLLFFDVKSVPTPSRARLLEAALRTLERRYVWGPSGLLFTAGWGAPYFERVVSVDSPVPAARALSDFELPAIDEYDLCLHLACDDEQRLTSVEAALVHGVPLARSDGPLDVSAALNWRETRTGFVGTGLPAAHQDVGGIPPGRPVPSTSPLFMGFKSSLRRNQASEDDVTIPSGSFAQGTTMQVSYMRLRLESWYGQLSEVERVARMYAPQVTPAHARRLTTDAPGDPARFGQAVRRYGVVGHSQASARVRRNGRPLIIRRDFDTIDGGQAGVHFVSLQRTVADFIKTREAMNATSAQLENPSITDTVNNGINEFIFDAKRGNYVLPPRSQRSFPLLPGRERALS
jgi:hypothetical protein